MSTARNFSRRMGILPIEKTIQLTSMDTALRNSLWNIFKLDILTKYEQQRYADMKPLLVWIWRGLYKLPADEIVDIETSISLIRYKFFHYTWNEVYDFWEFIIGIASQYASAPVIRNKVNDVLEQESSAYRFVGNLITPITNEHEISTINDSISETAQFTSLHGCNLHLTAALKKLSDREHPDYRNSIKESISAVESIAKVISGKDGSTLKPALDKISQPLGLHQALIQGFGNLYGWTSQDGGIRHAMMEASNCDFEDAKYMLVSCSAFVNYLIAKCSKAGIALS